MELTLSPSRGRGGGSISCRWGRGCSGSHQRNRLAIWGGAKAVWDAVGPADILMGVNEGLKAAEVGNWGCVGHMLPAALKAILADTTDPEIMEARTMVGGGEYGKLIRVDGIEV